VGDGGEAPSGILDLGPWWDFVALSERMNSPLSALFGYEAWCAADASGRDGEKSSLHLSEFNPRLSRLFY
jgi:hypothetical protein